MISENCSRHKVPEFLLFVVHHLASDLQKAGLSAESAKEMAIASAARMAVQCGGQEMYFPKRTMCSKLQLEERDWDIYREFNGTNCKQVCAKHGISRSRLYQVIAAIHQDRSKKHRLTSKNTVVDR